jgi:hypothetical protein
MCFRGLSLQGIVTRCAQLRLPIALIASATFSLVANLGSAHAQGNNNGNFFRVVGGVMISTDGVVRNASVEDQDNALDGMRQALAGPQGDLSKPADRRLISLKAIQKTVLASIESNTQLPEEVLLLGGLTRVENVFVYPERNDIVLAGPSEPWTISKTGSIVGVKSGRPIIFLDDLLCAFKTVQNARTTGISVSIEPTADGVRNLNKLLDQALKGNVNLHTLEPAMAQAFGPQQVKLEGLAPDSHMARVILAADYRMKLYGMNLAKAPVDGLPSYLEMAASHAGGSQLQSRWWMACDYNSLEHSADKLAWKISGPGIKTLTEQEQIAADGTNKQTGKVEKQAKKWADLFTKKMGVLAVADPVFGELRNVMDLCIVAALIESQNLQGLANCDLSAMIGDSARIELSKVEIAKSLDPQCSFIQTVQGWAVTASGGVMVDSWQVASQTKVNDSIASELTSGASWKNENQVWQ